MIKVELLDYKYRVNNTGFKNQNLVNFNNVDLSVSSSKWDIQNIGKIAIDGSQTQQDIYILFVVILQIQFSMRWK